MFEERVSFRHSVVIPSLVEAFYIKNLRILDFIVILLSFYYSQSRSVILEMKQACSKHLHLERCR